MGWQLLQQCSCWPYICKQQSVMQQSVTICIYTWPCKKWTCMQVESLQRVVFWTCMSIANGYLIHSSLYFVFGWCIGASMPGGHGDQPLLYIFYAMLCVQSRTRSAFWYLSLQFLLLIVLILKSRALFSISFTFSYTLIILHWLYEWCY